MGHAAQDEAVVVGSAVQLQITACCAGIYVKRVAAGVAQERDESVLTAVDNCSHIIAAAQVCPQVGMRSRAGDGQGVDARVGADLVDEGVAVIRRGGQVDRIVARARVQVKAFQRGKGDQRRATALQAGGVQCVRVICAVAVIAQGEHIPARVAVGLAQDGLAGGGGAVVGIPVDHHCALDAGQGKSRAAQGEGIVIIAAVEGQRAVGPGG